MSKKNEYQVIGELSSGEIEALKATLKSNSIVIETGCREWKLHTNAGGYGVYQIAPYQRKTVHRVSYEIFIGAIPKGMCVCHSCDNPICIEPSHFFIGTRADNAADRIKKGRIRFKFDRMHPHVITNEQVRIIRLRYTKNKSITMRELADEYNVHPHTIYKIIARKSRVGKNRRPIR